MSSSAVQQRAAPHVEGAVQRLRCATCKTWYALVYPRGMCTRERSDGEGQCGGLLIVVIDELPEQDYEPGDGHERGPHLHAGHDGDSEVDGEADQAHDREAAGQG